MLNLALSQPELSTRQRSAFTEERGLGGALLGLMDHQLPLLKAKAVIAVLLLCRWGSTCTAATCRGWRVLLAACSARAHLHAFLHEHSQL
jgi:serine/threonine-protein kinase ULK4